MVHLLVLLSRQVLARIIIVAARDLCAAHNKGTHTDLPTRLAWEP